MSYALFFKNFATLGAIRLIIYANHIHNISRVKSPKIRYF